MQSAVCSRLATEKSHPTRSTFVIRGATEKRHIDTDGDSFTKIKVMYLYVEMWKPRSTWNALSREQRHEYLSQMSTGIEKMLTSGVQLVGIACNDKEVPDDADYRYIAVWKMPNRGHVHMLEKAVKAEGWGNYFEIGNARGQILSVDQAIEDMVVA